MKFIDEMRERPEEERLAFAAIAAGVVALLLFLVWGIVFFRSDATVVNVEVDRQGAAALEGLENIQSEFSNVIHDASTQYDQIRRALEQAEEGERAVELSVDKNGDVHVDNIIVEQEELNAEN